MGQRYHPGPGVSMWRTPQGTVIGVRGQNEWDHPWTLDVRFEVDEFAPDGEWRAYVTPGFVNGRDTYINVPVRDPKDGSIKNMPFALTDDMTPWLSLTNWRNPLAPSGFDTSGNATPGEGYPDYFEDMGIRNPAAGGNIFEEPDAMRGEYEESKTREIRAIDIVLRQPRLSTRLDFSDPLPGIGGTPIQTIGSAFTVPTDHRPKMRTTSRYVPPSEDSIEAIFGLLLNGGDRGYDEIHMGTVWIVSPPDVGEDAVPDETWEPFPQYFVFWNLKWASNLEVESQDATPVSLQIPFAGGVANQAIDFTLSLVNQMLTEVVAFLSGSKADGAFWD